LRRLTVALSRARLGLYILGRREVFEACYELKPAFELLFQRPTKLQLVTGEVFPSQRMVDEVVQATPMEGVEHLGKYVYEMTNAKVEALKRGEGALPPQEAKVTGLDPDEDDVAEDGPADGLEDIEEEGDIEVI